MPEAAVLIGVFLALIFLGVPIAYCLGIAALVSAWQTGLGPVMIAQRTAAGMQAFPLIAIPLFIMAGAIMARGGVAKRIVDFAYLIVGPFPGGLAMVNCLDSMFFGGVSGSAVADISSTGPIMIPMMVRKGYDREFATALTVTSSVQGIIIPPSHNMVIYSMVAGGVSIGKLFLAGYIPGILLGVSLMVTSYILARKRGYPREKRPPFRESLAIARDGLFSLFTAVLIVGGIAFGIFTATEASAVAVFYAVFLGIVIYREMGVKDLWPILVDSVKTSAVVLMLVGTASAFGWMMTYHQIPMHVTSFFLSLTRNPVILLMLINILLLFLGMIMDLAPLILIVAPVLLPVVQAAGMSPVTFGIMLLVNLGIGLTTPPVGAALFVGCSVGKTTIEKLSRSMLVLWPAMLFILLLTTYVPWLTTFLPNLLMP